MHYCKALTLLSRDPLQPPNSNNNVLMSLYQPSEPSVVTLSHYFPAFEDKNTTVKSDTYPETQLLNLEVADMQDNLVLWNMW